MSRSEGERIGNGMKDVLPESIGIIIAQVLNPKAVLVGRDVPACEMTQFRSVCTRVS